MNILIIGGTGVLSSAVTNEAIRKGIFVTMINRGNRPIPKDVEHIKADIKNQETIEEKLAGRYFDAVIDFLCYTDKQTENSVKLYSKYTKQYFYISSCAVYDSAFLNGKLADEESKKVLSIWRYSVNKWKSEELLRSLFKDKEASYTVIRPCVTYGDTRIPYGIYPKYGYHWTLCARILAGKPIIKWNGGINRCNMMRVEDFAVGVVGLVGNPVALNEAFNICGDETPSWNDVLDVLEKQLKKPIITIDVTPEFYASQLPDRAGEILGGRSLDSINSNNKIKKAVPYFKQTIPLERGVEMTINAYKNQHYQNGIDWEFDGVTDWIIKKWCKQKGLDVNQYNLRFVDYLGTASLKDKYLYYREGISMLRWIKPFEKYARKILRR